MMDKSLFIHPPTTISASYPRDATITSLFLTQHQTFPILHESTTLPLEMHTEKFPNSFESASYFLV